MKCTRKLASLLLALVMVFALATTAFASETVTPPTTGTITVANPVANQEYKAYKIFDVVYDAAKEHYSYTIDSTSEWFNTVSAYATEAHGLKLTQVNGGDTYVVTTVNGFSAPDFAAALKKAVSSKTGKELTANGSSVTVDNLPLGYYFVASTSGALCNLTTTNPTVTIHDKNDMPFEKTADATDVEVGQTVTYTITGKVPDYTGFTSYTYKVADTMSEGLTFNQSSITVTVGGVDKTADCTTEKNVGGNANSFTVTIPVLSQKYTIGAEIKVTYSAVVNKNAIAVVSENEAKLIYSNDPTTDETKIITPPVVKVYSSKIVIDKVEKVAEGTPAKRLKGAEFVLYKEVTPTGGGSATKYYWKWNDTDEKVEWVENRAEATVAKTDMYGYTLFFGLADGTYYLVETKAPAGYNRLEEPVTVTVAGSDADPTSLTVNEKVENSAGTLLPSTGGMGTTVFYVLGAVLVVGAGVLLITKKRMSDANR